MSSPQRPSNERHHLPHRALSARLSSRSAVSPPPTCDPGRSRYDRRDDAPGAVLKLLYEQLCLRQLLTKKKPTNSHQKFFLNSGVSILWVTWGQQLRCTTAQSFPIARHCAIRNDPRRRARPEQFAFRLKLTLGHVIIDQTTLPVRNIDTDFERRRAAWLPVWRAARRPWPGRSPPGPRPGRSLLSSA